MEVATTLDEKASESVLNQLEGHKGSFRHLPESEDTSPLQSGTWRLTASPRVTTI